MSTSTFILGFAAALAVTAVFALGESALFSLGSVRLRRMKLRRRLAAPLVRSLLARPNRLLVTVIIGTTLAVTAASSFATAVGERWNPAYGAAVAAAAAAVFVFFLGETLPKTFGVAWAEAGATVASPLVAFAYWLFYPFNRAALALTNYLAGGPPRRPLELGSEDVYGLLEESERKGVLDEAERDLIERVVAFNDLTVGEIATPRTRIFALEAATPFADAARAARTAGFARIPVYEEDLERVVGILYAQDILLAEAAPPPRLTALCRPVYFVPASQPVVTLFLDFVRHRTHVALVVDEYGALDGLVTISDVLAEIVGGDAAAFRRLEPGRFVVSAGMDLADFNGLVGANLEDEEAETIGGYLINRLGRIPAAGEEYAEPGLRVVVLAAERNRVDELLVEKTPAEAG